VRSLREVGARKGSICFPLRESDPTPIRSAGYYRLESLWQSAKQGTTCSLNTAAIGESVVYSMESRASATASIRSLAGSASEVLLMRAYQYRPAANVRILMDASRWASDED